LHNYKETTYTKEHLSMSNSNAQYENRPIN